MASVTLLLSTYPEDVVDQVTHPVSGLPSISQWMPTLAEIKKACEDRIRSRINYEARQARIGDQLRERAELEKKRSEASAGPPKPRPTYEELIATLPDSLRIDRGGLKPMTEKEFLTKFPHVTKEQLDAVPDATTGPFAKLKSKEINPFEAQE